MRWEKKILVATAILFLVSEPAMAAQDVGKGEAKAAERAAAGTVTAVTPASRTVVVESTLSGKPWILGVEVPEGLAITVGGKTKKLDDLKAGERVRLRWIREENRLVAESIAVVGAKAP
ncbi:MAG: hypothetical protein HY803_09860 [candidate division NC10 bacterium]|nr:hypothetical protein [candidate division NC10 bacterium]